MFYKYSVLVYKRHNITYCRNGGHLQKITQFTVFIHFFTVQPFIHIFHKLIGYQRSANTFKRILTFTSFRIYYHIGYRQIILTVFLIHLMMVRDNDLYSKFPCKFHLRMCRNTVVTGDNHRDFIICRFIYYIVIDTVAVLYSVRYPYICIRTESLQRLYQYIRRTDSVYIIISHNSYLISLFYLTHDFTICIFHTV